MRFYLLWSLFLLACSASKKVELEPLLNPNRCPLALVDCTIPGSDKGDYEAARMAFADCMTECKLAEINGGENMELCDQICNQRVFLEELNTLPASYGIEIHE